MSPPRYVVSVCVVAVAALGLSACSSEKPSGLKPYTPSPSSHTSSPKATPSPTATSKWTPEQQQVIAGYDRFDAFMTAILTKAEKIDMSKAHKVGKEPFMTTQMKGIALQISAGWVETGKSVSTTSSVAVDGAKATMVTCQDLTHTKTSNPGNASAPKVQNAPPGLVTVTLVKDAAGSWLVSGLKDGGHGCGRG